jgi:hypothetical protein
MQSKLTRSIKIKTEAHTLLRYLPAVDVGIQDWVSYKVATEFKASYPELFDIARSKLNDIEKERLDALLTEESMRKGVR